MTSYKDFDLIQKISYVCKKCDQIYIAKIPLYPHMEAIYDLKKKKILIECEGCEKMCDKIIRLKNITVMK